MVVSLIIYFLREKNPVLSKEIINLLQTEKKKKLLFFCRILLLLVKEISKQTGCVCWHVSDSEMTVQTPAAYLYEQEKATATKSPAEFLKASSVPDRARNKIRLKKYKATRKGHGILQWIAILQ